MKHQRRGSSVAAHFALPICTLGVIVIIIFFEWNTPYKFTNTRGFFSYVFVPLRSAINTMLIELVPAASERALIQGLLLGGSGQFTPYWKQIFVATGTSHLVAVSGANIAYVAQLCEWILVRMPFSFVSRSIILCIIVSGYTILVGAPSSAVRAALMSATAMVAALLGRQSAPLHALATSILLMAIWDPGVIFNIGFQLSCAATLGLITTGSSDERITFTRAAEQTIAATAFTLPIVLYHFGVVSFVSLITNALIIPFIPVLTIGSAIALVIYNVAPTIGSFCVAPFIIAAHFILVILEKFAHLRGSVAVVFVSPQFLAIWCLGLVILIMRYLRRRCVAR